MKFVQVNNSIHCLRTVEQGEQTFEQLVVEFDARLDCVAPHVAGLLTSEEVGALEAWLAERAQLKQKLEQKPVGMTVLEALPNLLDNATSTLETMDTIDKALFKQIKKSLMRLDVRLSHFHKLTDKELTEFSALGEHQILKEQLDSIKQKVSNQSH